MQEQDSVHFVDDNSTTHLRSDADDTSDGSRHSRDDSELSAISLKFEDSGPDDALDAVQRDEKPMLPMDDDLHGITSWDPQSSTFPVSIQEHWEDREPFILGLCRNDDFMGVPHKDADTDSTMANPIIDPPEDSIQRYFMESTEMHPAFEDPSRHLARLSVDEVLTGIGTGMSRSTNMRDDGSWK